MDLVRGIEDASPRLTGRSGSDEVLADVEELVTDGRYMDAAEVLTRALSVRGPSLVLVRKLAWVVQLEGHDQVALELLAAGRRLDSSDLDAALDQAELLRELRRFGEALAVLSEVSPDRDDHRVARELGRLYQAMGLPALAVEAFGGSRALPRPERSARRHAWWRSGGPLRPLRQRRRHLDDKALRALPSAAQVQVGEPAALEAVLARVQELVNQDRVVAAVTPRWQELVDDGRIIDAAGVLVQGLSTATRSVELLRNLAHVEGLLDHNRVALALLNAAAGFDGSHPATKADHARTLVSLRRYRQAIALLTDLPEPARQDGQIRGALADAYRAMGLRLLALDAYGAGRGLSAWDRQARRRLWWRTGGPLWFVRRRRRRLDVEALRAWPEDAPLPSDEPVDGEALLAGVHGLVEEDRRVDAALERAQRLIDEGEYGTARDALAEELTANPPSVELLIKLAWVETLQDRDQAALAALEEARRLDPSNLQTVQDQVRTLTDLRRARDALARLNQLPEPDRRHPDVRAAAGRVYHAMGLPALAVEAYGDPGTLSGWQRRHRLGDWWRSGGPLPFLRRRARRFDDRVLRGWRTFSRHLRVLDTLGWPSGFDPAEIRSRTDWHLQQATLLGERWWSAEWWVGRSTQVGAAALTWLALFQVTRLAGPRAVWWAAVAAVVGTAVSFVLLRIIFFRLANADSWYGVVLRGAPTGLVLAGGGYGLTRLTGPAWGWPDMLGAVLVATSGMALCYFAAMTPLVVWRVTAIRRHWRRAPREDILDDLLTILDDLTHPGTRNDLDRRAGWMARLERAASTLEKQLPASLHPSDQATTNWVSERARGAASAVRLLKRQIAAPVDGSWDRLAAGLRDDVVAIATGDLGKLRWAAPPSSMTARRSRWKLALSVLRTAILAAVPLAAVVVIQPLLHLDAPALRWVKVISLAWALLYLLLAADPTLREKIETAQSVANLLGTARREASRPERRDPPEGSGGGRDNGLRT